MDFGYRVKERKNRLSVKFKKKPVVWERRASKLVKDGVLLDIGKTRKLIRTRGNFVVYKVFNVWKFVDDVKNIAEKIGASSNITLLKHGIFSPGNQGELFSTYGHAHEKYYGEFYTILKNQCLIVLADRKSNETFIVNLREGDSIVIHPKFLHRMVSYKKDVLMFDTSPKEAGHNYKIIKNKGFPVHVFYHTKEGIIIFTKNPKYRKVKFKFVKKFKTKIDPIKLFEKNPRKLKDILENPKKNRKFYFMGK